MSGSGSETSLLNFFAELRRRRVIRVAIVYAIVGWIIIEVASTMLPGLKLPAWTVTFVIALVVLGFPIAVIMGWMFDLGPRGVEKTAPAKLADTGTITPVIEALAHAATPPAEAPKSAAGSESDRHTIAVLPFVNMSGDAQNEYFSDGISEEILNLLTKLPQLKVASRTSSFAFKGKDINIPMVARELGVSTVLEGSVRRADEHVRITAQLIETESDSHLWSETYDREMKDVFAIQDDIARSIAEALKVALGPKERRALQNVATADAQAYDFYLKGRKYLYAFTRRDFHNAINMFERAIELDPRYALAYAGKADGYSMLYRYGEATPENLRVAEETSRQAIELDPDSAETQSSLGTALFITGQYAEAAKKFETAILINPKAYEPYLFYGRACLTQGDFEKAARLFVRASEVNPADYQAPCYLGMAYRSMGRSDLATQADARALETMERHIKLNPDDARALSFGASVFAERGQRERAVEWADAALQARENEPQYLYNISCAFAQLGDTERALDLLERAVALGWGDHAWMEHDSDLASLHDLHRFKKLLERMH
ncbi:MAG: tetratricopeptide repeat protein [Rhodanobacteraceae bacterium]